MIFTRDLELSKRLVMNSHIIVRSNDHFQVAMQNIKLTFSSKSHPLSLENVERGNKIYS